MNREEVRRDTPYPKPEGGYVQVSTAIVGLLLWGRLKGLLSTRAVRVGLALYELRVRRSAYVWTERKRGRAPDFTPNFSVQELARLCGLPPKRARAALDELLTLGILAEFSPERIAFARSLSGLALAAGELDEFRSWLASVTRRNRVPIPRRILALAAESSGPALIAVIVGACLRCCWLRPGEGLSFTGRLSCHWLARRFGVCLRAIQSAKRLLMTLDWLRPGGHITRFGEAVAINPAWHRLGSLPKPEGEKPQDPKAGGQAGTKSAPPESRPGTISAGVSLIESPPKGESKTQDERESPAGAPAGFAGPGFSKFESEDRKNPPELRQKSPEKPPPRLSDIRPALDFPDTGRCLELFRQAVKCGLMPNASEHSRLLWMAAIERARSVAAKNPAGVFLTLVKKKLWKNLSEGQFEAANQRLKAHLFGPRPDVPPLLVPLPRPSPRPRLSKDALLVQVLRSELARKGYRGDPFAALRAHAGFSRERYEAAVAELRNQEPAPANGV